jgi:hypothetical protein
MNKLLNIGFKNVGHWFLDNLDIKFNLVSDANSKPVLYCFVSNDAVMYIGKTSMELIRRMYGYQNPGPSQNTNIRVNKKINDLLRQKGRVDIFVFVDSGMFSFGGYKVNLAAGLEDELIWECSPEWNFSGTGRGKKKIIEDCESESERKVLPEIKKPLTSKKKLIFGVKLGNTYMNKGFFNVPIEFEKLFGLHKSSLEIELDKNPKDTIKCYVDRTINSTGAPRIMAGKALTEWIKKNFKKNDLLQVEVISKSKIRLLTK